MMQLQRIENKWLKSNRFIFSRSKWFLGLQSPSADWWCFTVVFFLVWVALIRKQMMDLVCGPSFNYFYVWLLARRSMNPTNWLRASRCGVAPHPICDLMGIGRRDAQCVCVCTSIFNLWTALMIRNWCGHIYVPTCVYVVWVLANIYLYICLWNHGRRILAVVPEQEKK